ncbi:MAG: hypothetical protein NVS4B11_28150 [Ktedonobacteraceae bacterium]
MVQDALAGVVAGALGTVALNIATYVDMAARGRPSSSAPSQMVGTLADKARVPLSSKGVGIHDEKAQNRESGLGALLGFVNGLGVGALYGLLRSQSDEDVSIPLAGTVLGLTAMAASDIPLVTMGLTNPKKWGVSGWVSDAIPHLIYGLVTALAYETLRNMD